MPRDGTPIRPTYVRFQTLVPDEDSHRPRGVFQAVYRLRRTPELRHHDGHTLDHHLDWLCAHLISPRALDERGAERAISWFHPDATEPIAHVRAMIEVVREYGTTIEQITTTRPGKVIYEDQWQIVAIPFRDS